MNRSFASLAAVCAVVAGVVFTTGCESQLDAPVEPSLRVAEAAEVLPADVQFISKVDVQEARRNKALTPIHELREDMMGGEAGAQLAAFIDATGFDPEKDLDEVYIAGSPERQHGDMAMVAYANFTRERLQAYIDENLTDAFERTDYKGVTVYRAREHDDEHQFGFALVNDAMMVAATDEATLSAMLDRLNGEGRSLKDDTEAMDLIRKVGTGSVWAIMRDIDMQPDGHTANDPEARMAALARGVRTVGFTMDISDQRVDGNVLMIPGETLSASDLTDLTKGALAAMKAGAGKQGLAALDEIDVRTAGDDVRVRFSLTNEQLHSLF